MTQGPAVSVIVHCDGDDAAALATLHALSGQTIAGMEVLLAGWTPSEAEARAAAPGIALTVGPPGGAAAVWPPEAGARNHAVAATSGAHVLELRAGDVPAPTVLEKAAWALGTRPRAGAVLVGWTANGVTGASPDPASPVPEDVAMGAFVVRREAFDGARGLSADAPPGAADRDLLLTLLDGRWSVVRVHEELVRLRAGAAGPSPSRDAWLRERHPVAFARADARRRRMARRARTRAAAPLTGRIADRVGAKLDAEGLTDARRALRDPVRSAAGLLPERIKGPWWDRARLPRRVDAWQEIPLLAALPGSSGLGAALETRTADARRQVLVLHPYLIAGGAETVVLNLLTDLDRERFHAHLITTEAGPPEWAWMDNPLHARFAAQTDEVFHLPAFLDADDRLRFVVEYISSRRIDVLLVSLSIFGYNALPAIRVLFPDLAVVDLLHAEAPYLPMDHIRLAARHKDDLDRRVVITESLRSVQIEKYGEEPARIVVIPNGVDTSGEFDPALRPPGAFRAGAGIGPQVRVVLFFGRVAMEKQPMHIVEVAERLRGRGDIVFAVVGDGAEKPAVEAAVARRGLSNVLMLPPTDDIAAALADATLTFFPSKREGLPMSGIESLAMGRPVVASRVPGWSELIDDGVDGLLVDDGDFDGYAAAISRLVDDGDLAARMAAAGRRKAVERFDAKRCVRAWEKLFDDPKGALP